MTICPSSTPQWNADAAWSHCAFQWSLEWASTAATPAAIPAGVESLTTAPLLIADEPTGNLDPETTNGILQLLHDLVQKDRTVVMATHDHHALQAYPGRVLHCSGGRIEETTNVPS